MLWRKLGFSMLDRLSPTIHISFEEQRESIQWSQEESYQSQDAKGLSNHTWMLTLCETHSNTIVVTVNAIIVLWTLPK